MSADSKKTQRARRQSVDDQSNGDVTKIRFKVAFLSVIILHDDHHANVPSEDADEGSVSHSRFSRLHDIAETYFDKVRRDVTIAGVTTTYGMAQLRDNYSKACPVNHIGYVQPILSQNKS